MVAGRHGIHGVVVAKPVDQDTTQDTGCVLIPIRNTAEQDAMVHISKLHHVWQGYVQITQSLDHGRNGVNVLILVEVGLNHDVDHVENKTL